MGTCLTRRGRSSSELKRVLVKLWSSFELIEEAEKSQANLSVIPSNLVTNEEFLFFCCSGIEG